MKNFRRVLAGLVLSLFVNSLFSGVPSFAAVSPGQEQQSFEEQGRAEQDYLRRQEEKKPTIEVGGPTAATSVSTTAVPLPLVEGESADEVSFLISEISLPDNEAISAGEVAKLVKPIENREISLSEILSLTDNLSQLYSSAAMINRISSTDAETKDTEVSDQLTFIISKINVQPSGLIPAEDVQRIVEPFEGKQVTLFELNELANNIDQLYGAAENINRLSPLDGNYSPRESRSGFGMGAFAARPTAIAKKLGQQKRKEESQSPAEMTLQTEDVAFFVEKFHVTGNEAVSLEEIQPLLTPFEGKQLKLAEVKQVAESITQLYRSKGFVTCRAYIPPQKLDTRVIEIRVLEGKLGKVKVQGNRFFGSDLISRFMKKSEGKVMDLRTLKQQITKMNLHPDREVKAIIIPGKNIGTSDLVLDVKDELPFHIGGEFNNFGTKLTGEERYSFTARHTNLTGRDDILAMRSQWGEEVWAIGSQYLIPVGPYDTQIGANFNYTDVGIGGDFSVLDIAGEAYSYGFNVLQPVLDTDNYDLTFTTGFEFKTIDNSVLSEQSSKDELRIAHAGMNIDLIDPWGRTFIVNDLAWGTPWFGASDKFDPTLSRAGAGANFFKYNISANRIHPLSWWESTYLMFKAAAQISPDRLVAAEQFDLGGAYSVRGYPQSDYLGENGVAGTAEIRIPFFFIPKDVKTPISKVPLWNRLNFVGFLDGGYAKLKAPVVGEDPSQTYWGLGGGVRFDLPHNLTGRFEWAAPLGEDALTDSTNSRFYVTVSGDIF